MDITAGDDFLGICDQKSSHKHVSDFGRLRSYGHFLIPVHALVSYGTSWWVMYSTWWLIVCGSCNEQLAQFTTERQPVLRLAVAFSKTSFKHRSIQIKGNFTKLICGNKMPTRCNRGFYCRSYCLLNMFRASPCPSSGTQEYYTVVAACGILCCKNVKIIL